jgi:hypothetical protein
VSGMYVCIIILFVVGRVVAGGHPDDSHYPQSRNIEKPKSGCDSQRPTSVVPPHTRATRNRQRMVYVPD